MKADPMYVREAYIPWEPIVVANIFEEFLEGSVVLLFSGFDGFLKAVVAGNEDGVGCTHGLGLIARILL